MLNLLQRARRVHAIEHATLHLLPRQAVRGRLLGRSDPGGFTLYGDADTAAVDAAAHQALARLQGGQAGLAVHPNCGTNLAVGGLLALLAGWLALMGRRRAGRGALAAVLLVAALGAAQPLGELAQARLTTSADVSGLQLALARRSVRHGLVRHRVGIREG
ncbi:MAG: DUF6391 domain-containing protein [Anaerolineae bacterium]|jgi:plasmid stabilization system protein ParE